MTSRRRSRLVLAALVIAGLLAVPRAGLSHPMGNFSISHYAGIRIERDTIRLRYLIDMAEIPTFQEIQAHEIVPQPDHPSLPAYRVRAMETLTEGLRLEVDGRRLPLRSESSEVIFPAGAGGLPTLKLGVVYGATLEGATSPGVHRLRYRDGNFADRAGWKEVVANAGPGVTLVQSSVPARDRSQELADYPTDLLNSAPQDIEAVILFTRAAVPTAVAALPSPEVASGRPVPAPTPGSGRSAASASAPHAAIAPPAEPLRLQTNQQATPRSAFTELIATRQLGLGIILLAMAVAAGLGAFHALEPGHGKTVVAAYLVGSRGTAWHALVLGLVVTLSHTAGVYLLGAVTLYASRYVVPERLYSWLGVASGLTIAVLGCVLFLRRYAAPGGHAHDHHHHGAGRSHEPHHHADGVSTHADDSHGDHHHHAPVGPVPVRELLALGVTGGIVPCPAALVVLLSAVALRRIGFGLLLIVAFSVGLAAVLIAIGLLMVYARRFMGRFQGEGRLITRWLPLTSAAVITLSGVGVAVQALVTAGILQVRL